MEVDLMLQKYPLVSKLELAEIWEAEQYPTFRKTVYESIINWLNDKRRKENTIGREAMSTGPLVHLLSAQIQPLNVDENKPVTAFGRIYLEFPDVISRKTIVHELYGQSSDDPQILGTSRTLALTTPDYGCNSIRVGMSSNNPKLVVDVTVGGEHFSGEKLCCTEVEQAKQEFVYGEFGTSLALHYIHIPFAVYGRVDVQFFRKQVHNFDEYTSHFIDVKGKVVARYCNTYGRFDSEECTLFDKEFERVAIKGRSGNVEITRSWIAVPVYSSLIIDLDLSECGTDRKLLNEKVQVPVERWCGKKMIIDDEYAIYLHVDWFSPEPQGRCDYDMMDLDDEMDGSSNEECDDQHVNEHNSVVPSNPSRRFWSLNPHRTMPSSSPAMEIFSVFVGWEQFDPVRMYGSVEIVSNDFKFQIFKREAHDALDLLTNRNLTVLDGSRAIDDCYSLEIKVDLKDVENKLQIKGFVEVDYRYLNDSFWLEKQLCSVVRCELGYAAIHYSYFPNAVQATIGISCTAKKQGHVDVEFYGTIVARYGSYEYTSRYNKDNYQVAIFQRNEENPVQSQAYSDGLIPLSRSKVIVPEDSTLIIEANLHNNISTQVLKGSVEFSVGTISGKKMTLEGDDYSFQIEFHVKWNEVSE